MKIAIPCENGEVMQHFGHATEFTVYTIEDIKPIEKETVTFDDTDHEKVAGGLKSRGIDLVICGNIGEGAHAAIDNAHMLLISGVTGNARRGGRQLPPGQSGADDPATAARVPAAAARAAGPDAVHAAVAAAVVAAASTSRTSRRARSPISSR